MPITERELERLRHGRPVRCPRIGGVSSMAAKDGCDHAGWGWPHGWSWGHDRQARVLLHALVHLLVPVPIRLPVRVATRKARERRCCRRSAWCGRRGERASFNGCIQVGVSVAGAKWAHEPGDEVEIGCGVARGEIDTVSQRGFLAGYRWAFCRGFRQELPARPAESRLLVLLDGDPEPRDDPPGAVVPRRRAGRAGRRRCPPRPAPRGSPRPGPQARRAGLVSADVFSVTFSRSVVQKWGVFRT